MMRNWQNIHASCVLVGPRALLVRGPAASGKSSLVLALLARARSERRFARLVADDQVFITAVGDALIARTPPTIAGRIERRGQGVLSLPWEGLARVGLVLDLIPAAEIECTPGAAARSTTIAGVALPRQMLPRHHPDLLYRVDSALAALQHGAA